MVTGRLHAMRFLSAAFALTWFAALALKATPGGQDHRPAVAAHAGISFTTADTCVACHNGLKSESGEDISIGTDWRGSIMANSSRDPYWQAAVRREILDHPGAREEIEDECSVCHMPMARAQANARGLKGRVFSHLPIGAQTAPADVLAHDGVSCTICHQISGKNLGTPESFTGGFVLEAPRPGEAAPMFGPFSIDRGRSTIMRSAAGFAPTEGAHIRQSEMCATCHTLYTTALGPDGQPSGRLAEQVPYLEWRHSAFPKEQQSCQTCHMPVVRGDAAISSVLGTARSGVARHVFRGGNFFMLRMLNRYRSELGVAALPEELDASTRWTVEQLQNDTASIAIDRVSVSGGRLEVDVAVRNLAGHKLPSAYPSRRAWLELSVRDGAGREIFHSGAVRSSGAIDGNDNDVDPLRYEPHYTEIREQGQVQIYESVMADTAGAVTTGLLRAARYVKDNRLLPRGFEKATAHADVAVVGAAADDADFTGGSDRVRYAIPAAGASAPFTIDVKLHFQPIGFRWAQNLKSYDAPETKRFVSYYDSMSAAATEVLATASMTTK
jgi:hypothetical protein